jgi:predicted HTH domain antitoxin
MDKRIVIAAYKRGIITIQECAQILGLETGQMKGLINDPQPAAESRQRQPAHG